MSAAARDPDAERELERAYTEERALDLRGRAVRAGTLKSLLLRGDGNVLQLSSAHVTGTLALDGAEIRQLLRLDSCEFDGAVTLEAASTLAVSITDSQIPGFRAPTAQIGGRLDLRGSTIDGQGLNAVKLVHAHIAGGLRLDRAKLIAPGRVALDAGGLVMEGGVFCEDGFTAEGQVLFPGAQLPGGLFMRGALIVVGALDDIAFNGDGLMASRAWLCEGFRAEGTVRVRGAQIADLLSFDGAELLGEETALLCIGARADTFDLRFARTPQGNVDLRNAHASRIQDHPETWSATLRLDGLAYEWLETTAARGHDDVTNRLAWLHRSPGYAPQPYEQLAENYRRLGHDADARRVLLARQRRRRATLGPPGRAWGCLLDATVGYGYRPWIAGVWLALLTLLGAAVFTAHTPTADKPGEGPPFNPFVYALDLLLPIGGFGQGAAWHWQNDGVQALAYALTAIGWILTTTVVAGMSRTLSRN